MGLATGFYTIQNGDDAVGRHAIEDRSLLPKVVFNQPFGGQTGLWVVEQLESDSYILRTQGGRVAVKDNKLVALLIDTGQAEVWQLVPVDGKSGAYRVVAPGGEAWVVREPGESGQIEVLSSVPAGASDVFTFTEIPDEE